MKGAARILNEAQHTPSFMCSKCPTFLSEPPTLETSLVQPRLSHQEHCSPFQKNLSTATDLVYSSDCIGSFSPLSSCKPELRRIHIRTPYKRAFLIRSCWYFLRAGTWGIFLRPSGKLFLRFRHSFYIEELVSLLEHFSNCRIRCVFWLLSHSS